jgi:hypothetical protein
MKNTFPLLITCLISVICSAQTVSDHDEFVYNRRLVKTTHSYIPKNGFVPDKDTALAIAYAVALPIYGKKQLDGEKPLRAELEGGVWTILGTLNCGSCDGGTLVMQIDKTTGRIVFLTHTM